MFQSQLEEACEGEVKAAEQSCRKPDAGKQIFSQDSEHKVKDAQERIKNDYINVQISIQNMWLDFNFTEYLYKQVFSI